MLPQQAHAQSVPSTVDPARIETPAFSSDTELGNRPVIRLPASPPLTATDSVPNGDQYRFVLQKIIITGNTAYTEADLLEVAASELGQEISINDLYKLAARMTRKYQEDGYTLSQVIIPPQEVNEGTISLVILEGYIADVAMIGAKAPNFPTQAIIRDILAIRPLNIHQLEPKLLLLNEIPGMSVQGILAPLSTEAAMAHPGGVRLELDFKALPQQFMASLDNAGSRFVGPWRMSGRASMAHQLLFTGTTSLTTVVTPRLEQLAYLSLSESAPVSASGLRVVGSINYSKSVPGDSLSVLELDSEYVSLQAGLEYPLWLKRAMRLDLTGGLELNNSRSDTNGSRFYDDRLRVVRLGVRYQDSDLWGGQGFSTFNISQGLDVLGNRPTGSADLSRLEGRTDFTKLDLSLSYLYPIGESFSLRTSVMGQYAFSPLLSSEEFGFGGAQLGRGYTSSELTGDAGIAAGIELAYHGLEGSFRALQPFVFYDIGKAWNHDSGTDAESAASAGAGLRAEYAGASLSLTLAKPLTQRVESPIYGNGKNMTYLLNLQYEF